jgi:hypothetical protein
MTFNEAYHYADLVFSQRFEGIKSKLVDWNETGILYVNQTQKYGLTRPISDNDGNYTRKLYISKIMRASLAQMETWITKALDDTVSYDINGDVTAKYLLYSGHDQQLANMLEYLLPLFVYDYVPYATIFTFELRQDNECMKSVVFNRENCMMVRIKYNGQYVDLNKQTMYENSII